MSDQEEHELTDLIYTEMQAASGIYGWEAMARSIAQEVMSSGWKKYADKKFFENGYSLGASWAAREVSDSINCLDEEVDYVISKVHELSEVTETASKKVERLLSDIKTMRERMVRHRNNLRDVASKDSCSTTYRAQLTAKITLLGGKIDEISNMVTRYENS